MGEIISLNQGPMQVLLVEDTASDAEFIRSLLDNHSEDYCITHAPTLEAALQLLGESSFSAALLDLSLPDASELEGLHSLQSMAPSLPIVILTANNDETLALKAVESGAQDYLLKDKSQGDTVKIAINYAIQRKRFEDGVTRQANFDMLTGLANRLLFNHRLEMAIARARRTGHPLGLLFLDLNDFKHVNDTLGHAAGDMLLKEMAVRMQQCVRPYDTLARIGGDEFALLIEDIKEPYDCTTVAQKLINTIGKPVSMDMRRITVGVSIGITTCDAQENVNPAALIDQADTAMYRAKSEEGSVYCFYTDAMDEEFRLRQQLESELLDAVRKNQLTLCYQPKQSLENNEVIGVEALVRWDHPRLGTLLPGQFLELARESFLLEEIESWVLGQACKDIARWRSMQLPPLQVAVNVSAGWFDSSDFVLHLTSMIGKYHIPPDQLAIELPEEVFAPTDPARAHTFARLYKIGVGITMDKFGGHLSSLQSLKGIALSELKFDSRFSQTAGGEVADVRLVRAIVACAHALGVKVVASGVESETLRENLRQQDCDVIQGYVYSHPMPAAYLEEWLQNKYGKTENAYKKAQTHTG